MIENYDESNDARNQKDDLDWLIEQKYQMME